MEITNRQATLPAAVTAVIRARAAAPTAPLVEALVRPSLALTAGQSPTAAEDGSRLGGLPRLPEGTEWPSFDGRPMELLAQLDCAELARAFAGPGEWPLPADGLLLFFHDDWFSDFDPREGGEGCRVLHVPAGAPLRSAPPEASVVPPVPVRAEPVLSAPSYEDPELEALFPDDLIAAMGMGSELRDVLPQPKQRLLGWCDTDTPRPLGHRPLFQLEAADAEVKWGEVCNVSFWITDEDLRAGRFDRVRHAFEVA